MIKKKLCRSFLFFILIPSLFILVGCTSEMHRKADAWKPSYIENVSSLLISSDGEKLVFIGKDFHYIFDSPKQIGKVLKSSVHQYVTAKFGNFRLHEDNHIVGAVTLVLSKSTPMGLRPEATELGFAKKVKEPVLRVVLLGTRYKANNEIPKLNEEKLNKTYEVIIEEKPGALTQAATIAATPITLAADGVLVIGALVLSPIILLSLVGAL